MEQLKRLVREIHRRSLWQVLAIYVAVSWIALQVVDVLGDSFMLPEWLPAFALALLVIGLPIVLATAIVQEGGPSLGRADPTLIPQPDEAARPEARGVRRLFTWRNAISGGVLAFALWGIVATGLLLFGEGRGEIPEPVTRAKSVAVLPFTNMSPDPENEYFSDGITETIITHLSRIGDLKVISRTSVMQYKQTDKSLRNIADELGVATVLEGSVQRAGDRVRITAQLIDAESDHHLWAEQYNRQLRDIFAIQTEVALNITRVLAATLSAEEERQLRKTPTDDIEAYNLYLLGRHWLVQRSNLEKALDYFERAIEKDSAFALAYVGVADSYLTLAFYEGWNRDEAVRKAESATLRALAIDNTLGEAHASLGAIQHWMEWKWEEARKSYEQAIALNPGYAEAHKWYGQLLAHMGDAEGGLREIEEALRLDPLSPVVNGGLGEALALTGRHDDAIRQFRKALELAPELPGAHEELGLAYLEKGMYEEAIQELQPGSGYTAAAYSALGRTEMAKAELEASKKESLFAQLNAHVGMGEIDAAFDILDTLVEQRHLRLEDIAAEHPYYSLLRADPRYNDVLRRMGLPER